MSNTETPKSNLIEIRDLLKIEMDKFTAINSEMIDNKNDFEKIGNNYQKYSKEIDKGKDHITQLKKREFFENAFIYFGFVFFYCCVAYIVLKRFPLHKIILFLGNTLKRCLSFLKNFIENNPILQMINSMTNISYVSNKTENVSNKTGNVEL